MSDDIPEGYKMTELGMVPEGWEVVTIGSISTYVGSGITPRGGSAVYKSSGIPLLRSQNIHFDGLRLNNVAYVDEETHNEMKKTHLRDHDVLLNITGASIGRCTHVPTGFGPGNVNQHVCIIRLEKQTHHIFAMNILSSPIGQKQIDTFQAGLSREGLNYQQVKAIKIPLPSLPEQRRIAEILSAADETIERTGALIAKYRQIKAGLMADLLESGIDEAGRIRSEETHEFKDSPLERVPEGWEVVTLENNLINDIYRYPTFYNIEFLKEGIGVLKVENLSKDGFINRSLDSIMYISKETNDRFPRTVLKENDLVMAVRGATIGKIALIDKRFIGFNINPNLIKITTNQKKLNSVFFWQYMNSDIGKSIFELKVSSTAKETITVPQFLSIQIPLPPLPEQRRIAEILTAADDRIEKEEAYRDKLLQIKKGLMQDLLTGKVRTKAGAEA